MMTIKQSLKEELGSMIIDSESQVYDEVMSAVDVAFTIIVSSVESAHNSLENIDSRTALDTIKELLGDIE